MHNFGQDCFWVGGSLLAGVTPKIKFFCFLKFFPEEWTIGLKFLKQQQKSPSTAPIGSLRHVFDLLSDLSFLGYCTRTGHLCAFFCVSGAEFSFLSFFEAPRNWIHAESYDRRHGNCSNRKKLAKMEKLFLWRKIIPRVKSPEKVLVFVESFKQSRAAFMGVYEMLRIFSQNILHNRFVTDQLFTLQDRLFLTLFSICFRAPEYYLGK